MAGRRILYGTLLAGAAVLHIAYGQYVTHYVLLFVLLLPVLSLILSLPSMLTSSVRLTGGGEVVRGRACKVLVALSCRFIFAPSVWKIKLESQNLFTERKPEVKKLVVRGVRNEVQTLPQMTNRIGAIRCRIRSARVCDLLGLISLPVRRSGAVTVTVLPGSKAPDPEPVLIDPSDQVLRPKPMGFSEEHELRPYREGDAINLIHWKLSQKLDDIIVREPQEVISKRIIILADLPYGASDQQSVLEQINFIAYKLFEIEAPFTLHFGARPFTIRSEADYLDFLRAVLSEPYRVENAVCTETGNDVRLIHIRPEKEASQ